MDFVKKIDYNIDSILNDYVKKPTLIRGIVHLLLMLYAVRVAPSLPANVLKIFENQYFKLFVFALILWTAKFSPSTSILIAVAFMVTVNYANQKPLWEFLENVIDTVPVQVKVTPDDSVKAVLKLADAASMPTAQPADKISTLANIAAANVTSPVGISAIASLASQAIVPEAGEKGKVVQAAQDTLNSIVPGSALVPSLATVAPVTEVAPTIPAPTPAPVPVPAAPKGLVQEPANCYPMRNYDMSKVSPQSTASSFEDYQEWKA
jgi:hypothetical protein